MRYIDETKNIYRTVKKDNEYYLIKEKYDKYQNYKRIIKIEVKGKKNVHTFIKNNKLKKYEEEWLYD
jgi:hypothetical protein